MVLLTSGVNDKVATDSSFAKFVLTSIRRFIRKDWGTLSENDRSLNDANPESAMGTYINQTGKKIWIKADEYKDGIHYTIMFPYEY